MQGITETSSVITDRYNFEAEKLDWNQPHLNDQHKKLYDACNSYKRDKAQIHFDYLASNYEGMYMRMGYPDPKYVANFVQKFAEKNKKKPSEVKILDMACGTGLVGKYLNEHGFTKI
jgi:2-polyprenyl-3-methyl-5-hydroxy-6-metoxy-1,4-benzoquinol methylase